jgi:PPOX class probable F420-dependent enzyme
MMTDSPTAISEAPFIPISDAVREFLDDARFATIATIDPDGKPRHAVVWYTIDGDEIVLNSAVGRRWPTNLVRDPRVAFSVIDSADGYRWLGTTGRVSVVDDQATAQADIAGMARRYHADDPAEAERLIRNQFQRQARISFRMRLIGVTLHLD